MISMCSMMSGSTLPVSAGQGRKSILFFWGLQVNYWQLSKGCTYWKVYRYCTPEWTFGWQVKTKEKFNMVVPLPFQHLLEEFLKNFSMCFILAIKVKISWNSSYNWGQRKIQQIHTNWSCPNIWDFEQLNLK